MGAFYVLALVLLAGTALSYANGEFDIYEQLYEEIKPGQVEAYLKVRAELLAATPHKITKTVDGVLFDSDYDNGSLLDVVSAGSNTFNCTLYAEPGVLGTRSYWFRFRMLGISGRSMTLNIDHTQSPMPVIRMPGKPWRRTTTTESPSTSRLVFQFGADENEAEVAFFYPLGFEETYQEVVQRVAGSVFATTEVIGQSSEGRDLWMITVKDSGVPDDGKYRIWVHSRAHAGEVTSTHTMLGTLEQAIEDSPLGHLLRRYCIFNIVPLQNVDGVYLGHTRWDSRGLDPERDWCNVTMPEALHLKTQVDAFMEGPNPIRVALNLHSTQGNFQDTFFFKHRYPSVSRNFEVIQQNYIDAFANVSQLFNNLNPQVSDLHACQFIESYFWNNWGEQVMALTHEGHFRRRITDGQYITGDDYREIGRDLMAALVEYFDLSIEGSPMWQVY